MSPDEVENALRQGKFTRAALDALLASCEELLRNGGPPCPAVECPCSWCRLARQVDEVKRQKDGRRERTAGTDGESGEGGNGSGEVGGGAAQAAPGPLSPDELMRRNHPLVGLRLSPNEAAQVAHGWALALQEAYELHLLAIYDGSRQGVYAAGRE